MKNTVALLIILMLLSSCDFDRKRKIVGESKFQKELNAKFKDASKSPLTKKGLKNFKGLDFFPVDNKYKVIAKLTKTPDAPVFKFPTTTDRIASYKKYGIVSFTIDEKKLELDIYKEDPIREIEYKDHLFLPFLDKTNGKTSYAGGRFIDIVLTNQKSDTIEIDFNTAYNPYCAYSDRYSCPITPRDNYLDIEIKAGVMKYKK